ncbi:MAG: Fe-Mn family superoxide dismutase [Methylacidiphilales bacterium]|nr:Fe-Mn family superoxide dismutase [Candidatus Methylacidiphilales bacterium]MDW8349490.1 Fe-Mn family superoxide dismutase [Verrucomicrobiae bacterium]
MAYKYPNRQDELLAKVKGKTGKISDKTHEEHMKLYTGYVNKTNAILEELEKIGAPDPTNPAMANQIFSTLRSLKVDFTFAYGGLINHEIYFDILGGDGKPSGKILELINESFGSFDNYKKDLKATGIAARGWVWTGLDHTSGRLFNYIGDAQNTFPVWGVTPLLALDVYEHAYYADFYTARAAYIDEFINYIDWAAVERRLPRMA